MCQSELSVTVYHEYTSFQAPLELGDLVWGGGREEGRGHSELEGLMAAYLEQSSGSVQIFFSGQKKNPDLDSNPGLQDESPLMKLHEHGVMANLVQ